MQIKIAYGDLHIYQPKITDLILIFQKLRQKIEFSKKTKATEAVWFPLVDRAQHLLW